MLFEYFRWDLYTNVKDWLDFWEYRILKSSCYGLRESDVILGKSNQTIGTGAAYTYAIMYDEDNNVVVTQITDINSNDVSLLWIIPQFFIITVAEVMISITGLEFAYTQAPITLKSVLTSYWLLTVSVGNIVVIIVAEGRLMSSQVAEYLLFAGLILIANVIFVCLAIFYYEYVAIDEFDNFEYPAHISGIYSKDTENAENNDENVEPNDEKNSGIFNPALDLKEDNDSKAESL